MRQSPCTVRIIRCSRGSWILFMRPWKRVSVRVLGKPPLEFPVVKILEVFRYVPVHSGIAYPESQEWHALTQNLWDNVEFASPVMWMDNWLLPNTTAKPFGLFPILCVIWAMLNDFLCLISVCETFHSMRHLSNPD